MRAKTIQAYRSAVIEASSSVTTLKTSSGVKAIRVDQAGVLSILLNPTPEEEANFAGNKQDWNVLQGEVLQIQGTVMVQTDGNCRLVVLY